MDVERAMDTSAFGRMVSVSFQSLWDLKRNSEFMDERIRGHWSIALDRVLSRNGRYVRWVYWEEGETDGKGAGWKALGLTLGMGGGELSRRKCDGIWTFRVRRRA